MSKESVPSTGCFVFVKDVKCNLRLRVSRCFSCRRTSTRCTRWLRRVRVPMTPDGCTTVSEQFTGAGSQHVILLDSRCASLGRSARVALDRVGVLVLVVVVLVSVPCVLLPLLLLLLHALLPTVRVILCELSSCLARRVKEVLTQRGTAAQMRGGQLCLPRV